MYETPEALERTIAEKQEELRYNLNTLEQKASDLTDWRVQFEKRPLLFVGLAFGGGLLASAVLGGSRSPRRSNQEYEHSPAASPPRHSNGGDTWPKLKGALAAVAATAALELLNEAAPGLKERLIDPIREQMSKAPAQTSQYSPAAPGPMATPRVYNAPEAG